jgi:hypothetical protein
MQGLDRFTPTPNRTLGRRLFEGALVWLGFLAACGESSRDTPRGAATGGRLGMAGAGAGGTNGGAGSAGKGGNAGKAGSAGQNVAGASGTSGNGVGGATVAGRGGSGGSSGALSSGGMPTSGTAGQSGGQDSAGGEGGAGAGPLDSLVDAFCAAARTCCAAAGMPVGALAACEDGFASQVGSMALVKQGTVAIDASALAACVFAYEAAAVSCNLTAVLADCHGIFKGTLADGAACSDVFECDRSGGPKICLKLQDATDPNVGVCATPERGADGTLCGGSCDLGGDCSTTVSNPDDTYPTAFCYEEDGLFCPFGYGCAPLIDDGEYCDQPAACGSDGLCSSTCVPLRASGDSCQFIFDCAEGLTCDGGFCVPEPVAGDETCAGHPPYFD